MAEQVCHIYFKDWSSQARESPLSHRVWESTKPIQWCEATKQLEKGECEVEREDIYRIRGC